MKRILIMATAVTLSVASVLSGASAQIKVTIGYATASDYLPLYVAKDEGCFDKQKIDATLTRMPIVSNIPPALLAGSLQIGISTGTVLLQARDGGLDLIALAGATRMVKDNPSISLVVRKELDIKTAADLKGKKIGVPGINSIIDIVLRKWLKNNNVPITDVTFIEVPFPQMPDMIKNGTIDGAATVEPIRSRIVSSDVGKRMPEEFYTSVNPDSLLAFYISTSAWAKANPQVVAGFRACLREGLTTIKENPGRAKEIEKKYLGFNTPTLPTMTVDIKPEDFNFFVDLAKEFNLTRQDIDTKTLVAP